MNKTLLKKMQLGILSLAAVGLLAACGEPATDDEMPAEDPAVEEPAEDPAEDPVEDEDPVDDEDGMDDDGGV